MLYLSANVDKSITICKWWMTFDDRKDPGTEHATLIQSIIDIQLQAEVLYNYRYMYYVWQRS